MFRQKTVTRLTVFCQKTAELCQVKETCELCATLTLKDIVKARKRTTSKEVPAFFQGSQKVMYEVTLETAPSGGLFEATVLVDLLHFTYITNVHLSENSLSRINVYGDQSKCVVKTFPHLMKYCFCE